MTSSPQRWTVGSVAIVWVLAALGCVDVDTHMARCKAKPISEDRAKAVVLSLKGIKNPDDYIFEISTDEYEYLVYYDAKDESLVPSFGTVAVDFCGDVLGAAGPL